MGDSLRIRGKAGNHLAQWPRDVVTALVAIVWVRFLMQYADKKLPLTTKPLPGCGGTLLPWQLSFWPLKPFPCGGLIGRTAMEVPVEPESD